MNSGNSCAAKATVAANALVAEMTADPAGRFSASVYETARLAALAPSLPGHLGRIRFLLSQQHDDGTWGGPGEYGLAPSLSATEALLTALRHDAVRQGERLLHAEVARSADRGLRALFRVLGGHGEPLLPDTVAVEIIVPALASDINAHLDRLAVEPLPGLAAWRGPHRLAVPDGEHPGLFAALRDAVRAGQALPDKLQHSLEVIGAAARGVPFAEPVDGGIGCSPAATAAWLGDFPVHGGNPSVRYLRSVQREDGAVPVAAPLTLFERAWVLATFADAGVEVDVPPAILDGLRAELGESGAAGGPGLPPDADDTAAALYALARSNRDVDPSVLWEFRADGHFSCFPGERTPSTSANAHVLQALGACLGHREPVIGEVTDWLREHQHEDGSWQDKWHASPFYATACCAVALADHGGERGAAAVRAAVDWVLATQRADGSWGRWAGTAEETAYALKILLRAGGIRLDDAVPGAAARGAAFLLASAPHRECPPLWHDKDLYTPIRIVGAEVLGALHLACTDPRVAPLIDSGNPGVEREAS